MNNQRNTLKNLFSSLIGVIRSLYKLYPFFVLTILIIGFYFTLGISRTNVYTAFSIVIILFVSILIYASSKRFGEASLSLAAGILSVFSINWNPKLFIAFSITWLCFACFSIMIASIRIASEVENIMRMTAIKIDSNNYKKVEKKLEQIRKNKANLLVSPIEACRAQLILAYNNIPISSFSTAMNRIEQLKVITGLEYKICTNFVIDLLNLSKEILIFNQCFDKFFILIRDSPYVPNEMFVFIKRTKYYVLSGDYTLDEYLKKLKDKLIKGFNLDELERTLMD